MRARPCVASSVLPLTSVWPESTSIVGCCFYGSYVWHCHEIVRMLLFLINVLFFLEHDFTCISLRRSWKSDTKDSQVIPGLPTKPHRHTRIARKTWGEPPPQNPNQLSLIQEYNTMVVSGVVKPQSRWSKLPTGNQPRRQSFCQGR
jgi:hypothetical protein